VGNGGGTTISIRTHPLCQRPINTGFIPNLFLSVGLPWHIHYLVAHKSHTSSSLFSRGSRVQNPSQSEAVQFVLQNIGDAWHWVTHVNYNCCCYSELFRRLEPFRPAKHKQWVCTCLLQSPEHWIQHLGFWLHLTLSCGIILHFKQARYLTPRRPGDRSQVRSWGISGRQSDSGGEFCYLMGYKTM
jgi:hypothetical protein